jgi:hypothetical protein
MAELLGGFARVASQLAEAAAVFVVAFASLARAMTRPENATAR